MNRSLGLILALVTTTATPRLHGDDATRQIAEAAAAQWNAAFAKGQVDAILSLYADDAMLVQPNGDVSRGAAQIRPFWQTLIPKGDYAMDVIAVRGEPDGTIVTTAKVSDVKTLRDRQPQVMKYRYGGVLYSVLKRQADGSRKAQVQRWNSDRNT